MKIFDVELVRIHKSSPYNCCGYIPNIKCEKEEDVINLPEVQKMIASTYGKAFICRVWLVDKTKIAEGLEYSITKNKAIV